MTTSDDRARLARLRALAQEHFERTRHSFILDGRELGHVKPTPETEAKLRPDPIGRQVACGAYSQAKAPLAVAEQMGVFDAAAQTALAESIAGADQLCSSATPPADLQDAITRVSNAGAAVLLAVAQAQGKPAAATAP
jgi:hypothetical protein